VLFKTLFLILLCFFTVTAHAQREQKVFLRKYTQQNGLSSFYARQTIQDKNGFIYAATQEGMDRYDGKEFIHYRKTATVNHRLAGIDIRAMIEDSSHNLLWVLPGENGINAINTLTGNVVKFIPLPKKNENEWNLSLFLYNDKLLIGTSLGVRVYSLTYQKFLDPLSINSPAVPDGEAFQPRIINEDKQGNVWVCYNGYGIIRYNRQLQQTGIIPNSSFEINETDNEAVKFNSFVFINQTQVLVATNYGLRKINISGNGHFFVERYPCKVNTDIDNFSIQSVFLTGKNQLYIAGAKQLYLFDTSLSRFITIKDAAYDNGANWLADVLNIYEDKDANIWIGCNQGLAFFKSNLNPFSTIYVSTVTKEKLEHVTSIFISSDRQMFTGLFNGLAVSKEPYNTFKTLGKEYMFYHSFEDANNKIHISRADRMFIYQSGELVNIEKIYPEFKPYCRIPVNSHVFFRDSLVILGTENYSGILVWNYKKHTVKKIDDQPGDIKLGSGIVNTIYKDKKDRVWVLSDNVITVVDLFNNATSILSFTDTNSGFPAGLFFDMCELNGKYWITSYGSGILELDSLMRLMKIFSSKNGLSNDCVYKIYPYKTDLITTSNYGLSVLNASSGIFKNYFQSDGLHSDNFEEAVGFMKSDTLYAGGIRGLTVIDPSLFYTNTLAPHLFINRLLVETSSGNIDSSKIDQEFFRVPDNVLQVTIHFSGINYFNPEKTAFAYRIVEKSKEWIDLGSQNFVTLIGLSPDTYHLQVKVANEDGIWSEPKELVLQFLPKWYQTWWFKLLVILVTAGIIYAFYRYRIRQIKKQHEIRKNIATDLHDDLGSTLNSVKVFTNLAISGVKQEESLQQIKDNLNEATVGLRDMIWVLDDSLDTVDELVTRLKQYAIPVAAANSIDTIIKADSEVNSRHLTKEEKRNLFLICKEVINNSIKYSGASRIEVSITPAGKKIAILIADNGKGFNEAEVKKGYGLKNMQYRAGQVKYKAVLNTAPGKGTWIKICPV
jgi:ligand-binding sensor domain-containing protein/anti-sigma regulatory factor (Ser/Thr protein kinase)